MKKIFIVGCFLASAMALNSNELAWVDKQIEAIKPPREGISDSVIASLSDPFIFLNKKMPTDRNTTLPANSSYTLKSDAKAAPSLRLTVIMNNSALINGKWYEVGDTVHGYKIVAISTKSANLANKKSKLTLTTQSNSKNLKFKNK